MKKAIVAILICMIFSTSGVLAVAGRESLVSAVQRGQLNSRGRQRQILLAMRTAKNLGMILSQLKEYGSLEAIELIRDEANHFSCEANVSRRQNDAMRFKKVADRAQRIIDNYLNPVDLSSVTGRIDFLLVG